MLKLNDIKLGDIISYKFPKFNFNIPITCHGTVCAIDKKYAALYVIIENAISKKDHILFDEVINILNNISDNWSYSPDFLQKKKICMMVYEHEIIKCNQSTFIYNIITINKNKITSSHLIGAEPNLMEVKFHSTIQKV